ncbi:MAG TPA: hypothetical protein VMF62_13480 [Acetobacteraceae bacterium]|nr:hypothetical protein [Acetobacteraceae bacterium]
MTGPDIAAAAAGGLHPGETRIATAELLERLRPAFPDLRAEALGRALTAAGWRAGQWWAPGTKQRVRGYRPPEAGPAEIVTDVPIENGPAPPQAPEPAGLGAPARTFGTPGAATGLHGPDFARNGHVG